MRVTPWSERWQRFWHAPGGTFNLALFRIAFAGCLWFEVDTAADRSLYALDVGFHLPYVSFLGGYSPELYQLIHALQYPLIALLALGLFTRPTIAGLLLLQGSIFFADQLNFRNHPYFFQLVLLLLLFSPADDALSLKSLIRSLRQRAPVWPGLLGGQRPLTFQRMLQVQVCVAYLWAALHKIHPFYLDGGVLGWFLADLPFDGPGRVLAAWFTVVAELLLPFGLFYRRTRVAAIAVGVTFHLTIAFSMHILEFSAAMIASYLLFIDPDRWPRALRGTS